MLIEYGKLMKYQPEPSKGGYCYDGPLALRQFGPKIEDAAEVLENNPWCATRTYTPYTELLPSILPLILSWILP